MPNHLRVLVTAPPILPTIHQYQSIFAEQGVEIVLPDFPVKESISENDLHRLLQNIDGILCGDDQLTRDVLEKAPRLKVISKWGTGIDSIDAVAAKALGILVCRVEDAFAAPVADTVLAYILLFARQIKEKDELIRRGAWHKVPSLALKECSLGVIGCGHIGRAVLTRAAAFGMTLYGTDPKPVPDHVIQATGVTMVPLTTLLQQSDFISLNCDLNPTSLHLISANTLSQIRPHTVIINTARGALIDEAALIDALQHKKLGGVALDVFEHEPLPEKNPLRQLPNVWLSPHNSNASPSVFKYVDQISIRNLLVGLKTGIAGENETGNKADAYES